MARKWLGSVAAAVLCMAAVGAAGAAGAAGVAGVARAAPQDPEVALRDLYAWRAAQIKQAQDRKAPIDGSKLRADLAARARAALEGVTPAAAEPAKCVALAQLYSIAQMPARQIEALKRYLESNPPEPGAFNAGMQLLVVYSETDDAAAIVGLVGRIKPPDAVSAVRLARIVAGGCAETVGDKLGARAGLDMLARVEALVPFAGLASDSDKQSGDWARASLAAARADLLDKDGKRDDALAELSKAIGQLDPKSPALATVRSKLTLIKLVGAPAPPIARERGYGDFAGLDKWRGKVAVIDFGAHW